MSSFVELELQKKNSVSAAVCVLERRKEEVKSEEIQEETRLVLEAFVGKALSVPLCERPGRVGGAYRDSSKFGSRGKTVRSKTYDGWDSLDEQISAAEEKKHGFKDLIKKRLHPRRTLSRRSPKASTEKRCNQDDPVTLYDGQLKHPMPPAAWPKHDRPDLDALSPSSCSSADEGGGKKEEKKNNKKKKKLKNFSTFIQKITFTREPTAKEDGPRRPNTLPIGSATESRKPVISPTRSPQFYEEVAETLGRIAKRTSAKKRSASPVRHSAATSEGRKEEEVIQELVQALSMQGDALDRRIRSDPFLRSSLEGLSYHSFEKMLDMFAGQTVEAAPPSVNPTLSRIAATMELSRRVITATGAQRMLGYAEEYMKNFTPWVKSQGGWERIVQFEDSLEYD
ncbi:uncharacterized protein LOC108941635 [Scleropages formosus]|uniref:uncharacterized protein LOC108941635 n=1 Tax=Scleropages formosus TaxID=113540 RepID=UPI0008780087|nr:uncharacterized protein LOC108941635 [Scleropages formosus]